MRIVPKVIGDIALSKVGSSKQILHLLLKSVRQHFWNVTLAWIILWFVTLKQMSLTGLRHTQEVIYFSGGWSQFIMRTSND